MDQRLLFTDMYEFRVTIGEVTITVIAKNYSSAKYKAFKKLELDEIYNYYDFINNCNDIKVNKINKASLSSLFGSDEELDYCRKYRNMPFLKLGMKVIVDSSLCYIIDGTSNLIGYEVSSGECINFHPTWITTYYDENNNIIAEYN